MINEEVLRCLETHGRSKNWLAKRLNISWTAVKDKINKDNFTGNELLTLCNTFDDFDINKLIEENKCDVDDGDDSDTIYLEIRGDKIGTLHKEIGFQKFDNLEAEELFNKAIPFISMNIEKRIVKEKNLFEKLKELELEFAYRKEK